MQAPLDRDRLDPIAEGFEDRRELSHGQACSCGGTLRRTRWRPDLQHIAAVHCTGCFDRRAADDRPPALRPTASTSARRDGAPGRIRTATSSQTTAASSMKTESGRSGAGATRSTRAPAARSASSYAACWRAATVTSMGARSQWVNSQCTDRWRDRTREGQEHFAIMLYAIAVRGARSAGSSHARSRCGRGARSAMRDARCADARSRRGAAGTRGPRIAPIADRASRKITSRCCLERLQGCSARPADFHIDPWGAVERAVITHAHGDHARPGSDAYLCAEPCAPLLRRRFGDGRDDRDAAATARRWRLGLVRVSFHPAGHVLGSAQIRIEGPDGVWVVAGRLQARRRPDVRAVRTGSLRHVRHRIDVRPADLPLGSDQRRHRRHPRLVARERRGRARPRCSSATRSARRSGCSPELARVTDRTVLVHGMMAGMIDVYRAAGVAC